MMTDTKLQEAVQRELAWDTRVPAAHIGVAVDQGVVTLTGTVGTYAEQLAAEAAAHRVAGVLDVANDITVMPPEELRRTDSAIAQAVRHTLEWDVTVPDTQIRSTVSQGWVTLEGSVDSWHQRQDAERAVRHLTGVHGVVNHILVNGPAVSTGSVREEIEHALERRAEREARRIFVTVDDGTVTLNGRVHSLPEKLAVVGAARGTPGVRAIHDHLVIDLTMP
jgi:osmotically-inducible protein OsmY